MSEKQRRIENVRRRIVDVERPLRRYFESFASMNPSEITPPIFSELQDTALALQEAIRREMQEMYDLLDHLACEITPEEQIALGHHIEAMERIRLARLEAERAASIAQWETAKLIRAMGAPPKQSWLSRIIGKPASAAAPGD